MRKDFINPILVTFIRESNIALKFLKASPIVFWSFTIFALIVDNSSIVSIKLSIMKCLIQNIFIRKRITSLGPIFVESFNAVIKFLIDSSPAVELLIFLALAFKFSMFFKI